MEVYSWIKNSRILGAAYDKGYEDGIESCQIDNTEAYQQGLNDAWECAKKLLLAPSEYDGALKGTEIKSIFGTNMYNVLKYTTPSDAIAKIKKYKDKQRCDNCCYPLENPLCGVAPLNKIKDEIEQIGAYYQEVGEQERANAFLEVLSIIDNCIAEKECKHCEHFDLSTNKCLITEEKCYENKECLQQDCKNYKKGEWCPN